VAEVVPSEATRSLVTMLKGSMPRPAERRSRAGRSARWRRRDTMSSSSTTDVSRSGDESAVAALLGAFRATSTPSTVRKGTRGVDPRAQPSPDSAEGQQGGKAARQLPRGIDPKFPTQQSSATGPEAEGCPTQTTSTPLTRVVLPKSMVNHPNYWVMFDCETHALDNKSVVYTRRQARNLGRRKKKVAQSFAVHDTWDGSPPAEVFQFLRKFAKACGDNDMLERSGDRGWGTRVKWLSGLSLCVCVRTCFVGCPKVRPPLPAESTSQIVPTGPSAPSSRAHTDAHALAPNRITHQIKSH